MPIKDVLVYLDNDSECSRRTKSTIQLCAHFDAHLAGIYFKRRIAMPSFIGMDVPVEVLVANDEMTKTLCESAEAEFKACLKETDATGEFRAMDGSMYPTLLAHSRYIDLLVIPQINEKDDLNDNFNHSDVLMAVPCPVLMVPDKNAAALPAKRVLLAWDDSRESARAVMALLALDMPLEKIDVVSVSEENAAAIDITQHLHHHGIESETHFISDGGAGVSDRLNEMAASLNTDMIAMGAYGHSRIREWVLGGATYHMLREAELPVLFAH